MRDETPSRIYRMGRDLTRGRNGKSVVSEIFLHLFSISKVTKLGMQESTTELEEIKSKLDDINVKDDEKEVRRHSLFTVSFGRIT